MTDFKSEAIGEHTAQLFRRVAGFDMTASESLFSAVATAVSVFLVIATAYASYNLWSAGDYRNTGEGELVVFILRSLTLLFCLGSMMVYISSGDQR